MRMGRMIVGVILGCLFLTPFALAQNGGDAPRELSEREERRRLQQLRKELAGPFKQWLSDDVRYIITADERKVFLNLATDEERENFIEQFWLRRDPTPDSVENEYREEHYRRIAYANERFASGISGWRTDRGRIYITFGPPDEIENHASGGTYMRPYEEGGGTTSTYPFYIWRYRYLDGVGQDIILEFVDKTMSGEYRLMLDPSEKDALLHVPGAGLTMAEEMGLSTKADRFNRSDGMRLGVGQEYQSRRMNIFDRLQIYAAVQKPPEIKFKDLETVVDSTIEYNTLPYTVDVQYVKITNDSVLTGITVQLQNKDLVFQQEDELHKGIMNIYGRVTTVTRRLAAVFEDPVTISTTAARLPYEVERSSVYQKVVTLPPGMYRLELVVKDVVGETMGTHRTALHVPDFDDETLASSSLILADKIERVPTRSLGTGQFVIGSSKVRPRINEEFKKNERLGIYMQVYNLGEDELTSQPKGTVSYQLARMDRPDEPLMEFTEDISQMRGASSRQLIIEKVLPLESLDLDPGEYRLSLKVTDGIKNETITPSKTFRVSETDEVQ